MTFDPDKFLTETDEFDPDSFLESTAPTEEPSQLEALGLSAVQGGTFGLGEELGAAALTPLEILRAKIAKLIPGSPEAVDADLRAQGFTGDIQEKGIADTYKDLRDPAREANTAAQEAHPGTYLAGELVGGIAPALLTGGGTAAANVGAGLAKTAGKGVLKQSMKEAGKLGAKYGAVSGAGYSEADLTEGDIGGLAKDTALGATIGAGTGALLPVAAKGVKAAAKQVKNFMGGIGDLIPESGAIKAAFQYGRQGKKITEDVLDEDLKGLSKGILKNIKKDKSDNNLQAVKDKLDELGIVVDGEEAILRAVDDMEKAAKGDYLKIQNKEVLPALKQLVGYDAQMAKLQGRVEKNTLKKLIESEGKESQAIIKGEKSLAKKAIQSGDDIQTITDVDAPMSQLDMPLDTVNGKIGGVKGKFKGPDGEDYVESVLSDVTPYQPKTTSMKGPDGRPIIKTVDQGSGKVSAIVGNIEDKLELDLKNMTISEVEALRKQLNVVNKMAKMQGTTDDPIIQKGKQLAVKLKELTDDVVTKYGDKSLIDQRARFSDIFSAEELLGIDKRFSARGDINKSLKEIALGDKLGFERAFKSRQEGQLGEKLLGKNIIPEETKNQLQLIRKLNTIAGRESQENISRAGLYKKAVGDIPNLIGRGSKVITDAVKPVTSPVKNVTEAIERMSKEQINGLASKLNSSQNKGHNYFGNQLMKAIEQGGDAQNQAMWALSQSAAFRELIKREAPAMAEEMNDAIGISGAQASEAEPYSSLGREIAPDDMSQVSRDPASVENIEQGLEHTLQMEGGFQNQKTDKGNFLNGKLIGTNMGITPAAYKDFYGKAPTVEDIKNLTKDEAVQIYKKNYIEKPKLNLIEDENLKTSVMDFGVNSGPNRAIKELQKLIGAKVDGGMGPETVAKIAAYDGDLNKDYNNARRVFIKNINNPTYEAGWLKRIDSIEELTSTSQDPQMGLSEILAPYAEQEVEAPAQEEIEEVERAIDGVNQIQSSGDNTPVDQIEDLMGKIDRLKLRPEDKNELENEAINMSGFSDGNRLKELLRKISELK